MVSTSEPPLVFRCVSQQKFNAMATLLHTVIDGNKDISFTTDLWTCDVSLYKSAQIAQWLDKENLILDVHKLQEEP